MYLTHPDQMARIRDMERDDPMFPKGVKQMLGFIYAMEGEQAGKASWHAKMIELKQSMNDGFLIRRTSVENGVPCLTSMDTVEAILKVVESMSFKMQAM